MSRETVGDEVRSGDLTVEGTVTADSLGVGTSTPSAVLDVVGNVKATSSIDAGSYLRGQLLSVGTSGGTVAFTSGTLSTDSNWGIFYRANTGSAIAAHAFADSSGTVRMQLDNAGLITGSGTSLGAWTAYTPTLGGSTTSPTLGTGSTADGYYCQIGKTVHVRVRFVFGSSMSAGSGFYSVSLPVTSKAGEMPVGSGFIEDNSAGRRDVVSAYTNSTTSVYMVYAGTSGWPTVSDSAPFAWAQSDSIRLHLTYEAE